MKNRGTDNNIGFWGSLIEAVAELFKLLGGVFH